MSFFGKEESSLPPFYSVAAKMRSKNSAFNDHDRFVYHVQSIYSNPSYSKSKITIVKETELDTDLIHDAAFESFHQLLKKKAGFHDR